MRLRRHAFASSGRILTRLVEHPGSWRVHQKALTGPEALSIYEVKQHTTEGAISQAALDSFVPSVGTGIAVADHMLLILREVSSQNQTLFALVGYGARGW